MAKAGHAAPQVGLCRCAGRPEAPRVLPGSGGNGVCRAIVGRLGLGGVGLSCAGVPDEGVDEAVGGLAIGGREGG